MKELAVFESNENSGFRAYNPWNIAYDGYINIKNNQSKDDIIVKKVHDGAVINLEIDQNFYFFSSNQLEIAMTDITKVMKTFCNPKNHIIREFKGHSDCIFSLKSSSNGNILLSGGADKTIVVWDVRTSKPINAILAHSAEITSIDLSHDDMTILSCSLDGYWYNLNILIDKSRLWDIFDVKCRKTLVMENSPALSSAKFSPNAKYILMSSLEPAITLWDTKLGKCVSTHKGINNQNYLLPSYFIEGKPNDKEKYIINLDEDNAVRVWDCFKTKETRQYNLPTEEKIKSWEYSHENIACLFKNNLARIFKLE